MPFGRRVVATLGCATLMWAALAVPVAAYGVTARDYTATGILKGGEVTFTVTATHSDSGAPALTFEVADPPHGTATVQADTRFCFSAGYTECSVAVLFVPDPGFVGLEQFDYTASDGGAYSDTGTVSLTYIEDLTPPDGSFDVFAMDDGAASGETNTTDIRVRIISGDPSGLTIARLSNSGAQSNGMLTTYEEFDTTLTGWPQFFAWAISNATGGTTAEGAHTVWGQWRDGAGNWSTIRSASINYDKTKPIVKSLSISFAPKAPDSGVPIRIMFTVSEPGAYTLQKRTDGGEWTDMPYYVQDRSLDVGLSTKHSYAFRVRAQDGATNQSAWKESITFKPAHITDSSSALRYRGRWSRVIYVGTSWVTARTRSAGASVTYAFKGRAIAWESLKGPGRGKAKVYLDGAHVKTVDLKASSTKWAVVFSKTWTKSGSHTITVVGLGTAGRPLVDVDGFGVLK